MPRLPGVYQIYFQTPGVAEAELQRDVRSTMRRMAYSGSGDMPSDAEPGLAMVRRGGGFLEHTVDPPVLPAWISEADIDLYTYAGALVDVPALYVAGDRDLVVKFRGMAQLLSDLPRFVPGLRRTTMLPGCGHWTQQERPREVNAAILEFLKGL